MAQGEPEDTAAEAFEALGAEVIQARAGPTRRQARGAIRSRRVSHHRDRSPRPLNRTRKCKSRTSKLGR